MNVVEGCAECDRLTAQYESSTMEWFRVQNQLGIAEHLRDNESSDRIVKQLAEIAKRRQSLRDRLHEHIAKAHPQTLGAC